MRVVKFNFLSFDTFCLQLLASVYTQLRPFLAQNQTWGIFSKIFTHKFFVWWRYLISCEYSGGGAEYLTAVRCRFSVLRTYIAFSGSTYHNRQSLLGTCYEISPSQEARAGRISSESTFPWNFGSASLQNSKSWCDTFTVSLPSFPAAFSLVLNRTQHNRTRARHLATNEARSPLIRRHAADNRQNSRRNGVLKLGALKVSVSNNVTCK